MKVHIFGNVDSPCIVNWFIKRTASDQSSQYENEIIERIKQNFYMDDYLDCFPSQEKAIETVHKVIKILSTGGSRLTKWLSNSKHILKTLTPAERSPKVANLDLSDIPIERAPGIIWDRQEDILQTKTINKDSMLTKRGLLSFISSIYDPIEIVTVNVRTKVNHSRTLEEKSSMGQAATKGYKAKMDCLEKEYTLTCKD